mmetsp:Transcript_11425/g.16156  ORF Transcript_11425/g.16156 Transcript_11425/m.16156 type:complete len:437 (-) Transcript_11425:382-1692(-)
MHYRHRIYISDRKSTSLRNAGIQSRTDQGPRASQNNNNSNSNNDDGGQHSRKGLTMLETALAQKSANATTMRKHVLSMQTTRNGFDFYFLHTMHAQSFASFCSRVVPMKLRSSRKMVSEDVKNNTANVKHTIVCDIVPLCKDDLIICDKKASSSKKKDGGGSNLNGHLCLVVKMSGMVKLVSASPSRRSASSIEDCFADLHPEKYWRGEKYYRVLFSSKRLIRYIVLDVELCVNGTNNGNNNNKKKKKQQQQQQQPPPPNIKPPSKRSKRAITAKREWFNTIESHSSQIIYALTRYLDAKSPHDAHQRLLLKFVESECEKCTQVLELCLKYDAKMRHAEYKYYRSDEAEEAEHNGIDVDLAALNVKLRDGGDLFHRLGAIAAFAALGSKRCHEHMLKELSNRGSGIGVIKSAIEEFASVLDDGYQKSQLETYMKAI